MSDGRTALLGVTISVQFQFKKDRSESQIRQCVQRMLLCRKQDEGGLKGAQVGQIKRGKKKKRGMEWPRREAGKRQVWVATPRGGQEAGKGSHTGRRARGG